MIRAVIFDIGNVLIFFSHERMYRQIGELCGVSPEEAKAFLTADRLALSYEKGLISSQEIHESLERLASRPLARSSLLEAISNIFEPNCALYPLVKELKAKGKRLVILSNVSEIHFDYLYKNFDILKEFDAYVLSYRQKALKPEKAIFDAAIAAAACPREEIFYTDDILEYVQEAQKQGIRAEQYTNLSSLLQHLSE